MSSMCSGIKGRIPGTRTNAAEPIVAGSSRQRLEHRSTERARTPFSLTERHYGPSNQWFAPHDKRVDVFIGRRNLVGETLCA